MDFYDQHFGSSEFGSSERVIDILSVSVFNSGRIIIPGKTQLRNRGRVVSEERQRINAENQTPDSAAPARKGDNMSLVSAPNVITFEMSVGFSNFVNVTSETFTIKRRRRSSALHIVLFCVGSRATHTLRLDAFLPFAVGHHFSAGVFQRFVRRGSVLCHVGNSFLFSFVSGRFSSSVGHRTRSDLFIQVE